MEGFLPIIYASQDDPSLAIAASRAGACGVLDVGLGVDGAVARSALERLARHARTPFGLRVGADCAALRPLLERAGDGLRLLVLEPDPSPDVAETLFAFRAAGGRVLMEVRRWQLEYAQRYSFIDGWIAKGNEAGGLVGHDTAFVLLQRLLAEQDKAVYVHGAVGMHAAAACRAAGAAGVVLEGQLVLLRESPVRERLQARLAAVTAQDTLLTGAPGSATRARVLPPSELGARRALEARTAGMSADTLRAALPTLCGWSNPDTQALPIGQDAALARGWAERYGTVARALGAMREAVGSHATQAAQQRVLAPGARLAQTHGTRLPLVQSPLAGVTDFAPFAREVAEAGALPMLALGRSSGERLAALLAGTRKSLDQRPWGVGLSGATPPKLFREQVQACVGAHPAIALLTEARPDQALSVREAGLASYVQVDSPEILAPLLAQGVRGFLLHGAEGGSSPGRLSSLVLWESAVERLLAALEDPWGADVRVLFGGGVHDARSAAAVAALAAPLAERGVQVGLAMGTAYLFTREIVRSGALLPTYQRVIGECDQTVLIERQGQRARFVATPYVADLSAQSREACDGHDPAVGESGELWARLRLAVTGREEGRAGRGRRAATKRQLAQGAYLAGQAAACLHEPLAMDELHRRVSEGACEQIEQCARAANAERLAQRPAAQAPADVAVVGIGCLLPGAAGTAKYWTNILDGVDCITEIPASRWDYRLYYDPDRTARDRIYSKWGGFLEDLVFDPLRYGIPPNAVKAIDPLQLMSLEVIARTLSDAGYAESDFGFDRERVSVILGASGGAGDVGAQYAVRAETPRFSGALPEDMAERLPEWTEDSFAGILLNVAAGRAANRFDFGGVNYTVDAACASSLTAVYQAVVELESGRSDMVIAGGIDTVQGPFGYLCFSRTQALSPRGRCSTFDAGADGIVISEGIAMVALKRLADAERDDDRIYAVIKGVGGSSDGRAKSMTAPRPEGQIRALRRAYEQAGYSPATVRLFEAHGTGTVAGDTAELETVTRLLDEHGAGPRHSAIGSVKSLIGHTKATAGIAGLIKVVLSLHHQTLPPHAGVTSPNEKLSDPRSPLCLLREPRPWLRRPEQDPPRRAGVSAFGFGGTNFHVTVEEYAGGYREWERPALRDAWPTELLVWRAADRLELARAVDAVATALEHGARPRLRDLAFTLAHAAPAGGETVALLASEGEDLAVQVRALAAHLANPHEPLPRQAIHAPEPLAREGKIAVLFAGQGAQYPNMLWQIALTFQDMRHALTRADELLSDEIERRVGAGTRLSDIIYPPGLYTAEERKVAEELITRTEIAQPALGVVEAGLWSMMERLALRPHMAGGHSYGEYVALHAAGVIGLDDLLRVSEARGRFIVEAAGDADLGTMAAVQASREEVEAVVREYEDLLVANHNAPAQSVISGSRRSVQAAIDAFAAKGIPARALSVAAAFHSPFVAPASDRLERSIEKMELAAPRFDVYSNSTGAVYPREPEQIRALLVEHLVRPVEFVAEIEAMYAAGARVFVGLGPKNVQRSVVGGILGDRPHVVVRIDDEKGGLGGLLQGLGTLLAHGAGLDLRALFEGRHCRLLALDDLAGEPRETPPPAHAWMLNGSAARPVGAEARKPLSVDDLGVQATATRLHVTGAREAALGAVPASAAPPVSREFKVEEVEMSERKTDSPLEAAPLAPPEENYFVQGDKEVVLAAYQHTMRHFLQTQERVMLAYLDGAGARRSPGRSRWLGGSVESRPSDRPALAGSMPAAPMRPLAGTAPTAHTSGNDASMQPAPLPVGNSGAGVGSAPAAQSGNGASVQPTPLPGGNSGASVDSAPAAQSAVAVPVSHDKAGIERLLLGIVEERTGYPQDMLDLAQDMEGDLGIDSIKRVEIVGALIKAFPEGTFNGEEDPAGTLNGQKTLGGIIEWCAAQAAGQEARSRPFELTGTGAIEKSRAPLSRYVVEARLESTVGVPLTELEPGPFVVADDGAGLGEAMAAALEALGAVPVLLSEADWLDKQRLTGRIREIREAHGRVRGLLFLAPVSARALGLDAPLAAWRAQTERNEKGLFRLLSALGEDLRAGGRIVAASPLGGTFARDATASPGVLVAGGFVGLLKSLKDEWPDAHVKAVDLDPELSAPRNAGILLRELRLPGGRLEVGYPGGQRTVFVTRPAPLSDDASGGAPEPDWVVLATGGARGITAEALRALAVSGMQVVLVGRTPEPQPEAKETAALSTPEALRRHLVEQAREAGAVLKPVQLEQRLTALLQAREMRANLADFRALGLAVDYRVADARDEAEMQRLFEDVYRDYGRLDGVVHGAGLIEDRLLLDKSEESWSRVFDTKADSAFLVAKGVRPEGLRFLAFFTSVAGRYGNAGQTDYAAANELVGRLACQLRHAWGGSSKVAAIDWGPWLGTRHGSGMVSPETRRRFEAKGVSLVDPERGAAFLRQEVLHGASDRVEVIAGEGPWEAHEAEVGRFTAAARAEYPLIAGCERDQPAPGVVRFQRTLDVVRERYLAEHLLDERPVLPAAVALELLAEAVAVEWPDWVVNEMRDLRVLKGIRLDEATLAVEVLVHRPAEEHPDGFEVALELRAGAAQSPAAYRVTACLARTPLGDTQYHSVLTPGKVAMPAATAYRERLFHGPRLQTMRRIVMLDNRGALANVCATRPETWLPDAEFNCPWLFDPGFVDAGPQMALLWAYCVRSESALPTSFARVRRFGVDSIGDCCMHFLPYPEQPAHQVRADVAFVDDRGHLRLMIEGMECTSSAALNRLGGGWKGEIAV